MNGNNWYVTQTCHWCDLEKDETGKFEEGIWGSKNKICCDAVAAYKNITEKTNSYHVVYGRVKLKDGHTTVLVSSGKEQD
jgi:hypothetical protein